MLTKARFAVLLKSALESPPVSIVESYEERSPVRVENVLSFFSNQCLDHAKKPMTELPNNNLPSHNRPLFSSKSRQWKGLTVEQFHVPPGESDLETTSEHTICICLSPQPIYSKQQQGDRISEDFCYRGDISITPASFVYAEQWNVDDIYLHLRLQPEFLQTVALEAADLESSRLELIPKFKTRDAFLEQISMSLLSELKTGGLAEKLYVESLINTFTIHLLRNYCTFPAQLKQYQGGLSRRQLRTVIGYIEAHLESSIGLKVLAQISNINSEQYFCSLFKQSMGIAPYQYVIQQRVELAKRLLKQPDLSLTEIALRCGFADQSAMCHTFKKCVGVTPSQYRRGL